MPTKRKFTAKFPTTRIKKIMQLDEDIGKLTATVPPVVSRSLELFMEQLITRAYQVTTERNSKTISPSSIKYVIEHDSEFGFLHNLVVDVPELKSPALPKRTANRSPKSSPPLENGDVGCYGDVSNGESPACNPSLSEDFKPPATEKPTKKRRKVNSDRSRTSQCDTQPGSTVPKRNPRGRPRKVSKEGVRENSSFDRLSKEASSAPPFRDCEEMCGNSLLDCRETEL
ncbi:unnamed protein product [Calicophoron daubneyi]|uniref:Transcription factor CBF/NF-Y/archaeal histone domain-containing protein n=1 Tax=Calicophoron daubneyi TaxID=300641 RepID=A0AAV2TAL6_CALDB